MPRRVSAQQVRDAQRFDEAMEESFMPVDVENYLRPRLAGFLAHHFTSLTNAKANALLAADWIRALMPFPQQVIDRAIKYWIEHEPRKPLPAQIREWCIHYFGRTEWEQWERARKIAVMHPSIPDENYAKDEGWVRPTEAQMSSTMTLMHKNGYHATLKSEKCPMCVSDKSAGAV